MKVCTKCGSKKSLDEFHSHKGRKDGKNTQCKPCSLDSKRKWNQSNHERYLASKRRYYEKNREQRIAKCRQYYEENRERVQAANARWREENRDMLLESKRRWYQENIDRHKRNRDLWLKENRERKRTADRRYYEENQERIRKRSKKWSISNRDRIRARYHARKHVPEVKACRAMRTVMSNFLRKTKKEKCGLTNEILGYSPDQLRKRMEFQFQPGMSWINHGSDWHIDHRIPVSYFIAKGEDRPHIVNALSNLQPLWAFDNLSKGAKIID